MSADQRLDNVPFLSKEFYKLIPFKKKEILTIKFTKILHI